MSRKKSGLPNPRVEFIRGRMTDADRKAIDAYADSVDDPKPTPIARKLNRHPGTVFWYMLNKGYLNRTLRYPKSQPYVRKGRMIYPYTPAEDARIEALRIAGGTPTQIAEALSREFNVPRTPHSVKVRLAFLAAYDEDVAAAA